MRRQMRYVIGTLALLGVLAVLVGVKGAQIASLIAVGEAFAAAGPPPEAVGTAVAKNQQWESKLVAVGSAVSAKGVALSAETAGKIVSLRFDSGQRVKQGQVLLELDSSVERAQLASLGARRDYAQTSLKRSRKLARVGAIPESELDADDSTYRSLTADMNALKEQISRKVVRAPFDGKLGIRQVNVGQYLVPGTPIADLESTDSVFVDFTLPQREVQQLQLDMPVRVLASGGGGAVARGRISAIDPTIDPATRSVKVRATLDDAELLPGEFVNVEVVLPERPRVVAVPVTAVVRAAYGDSVFIVEPQEGGSGKLVARQQFVRLGGMRGDYVAVLEGLAAGQRVVVSGAFKLRNNAPVTIDNSVKPKAELDPRPPNR